VVTVSHGAEPSAIERLDLRGTPCPLNFVKTKLRLDQLPAGTPLEIWLDPGEPMEQVPDSLLSGGYGIDQTEAHLDADRPFYALHVRRSS
jgi:TusA-related sulfurtransferase